MRQDRGGFTLVEIVVGVAVVAALGFASWTWYQADQPENTAEHVEQTQGTEQNTTAQTNTECSNVEDHMERYNCYRTDDSRQKLETAIENDNPELCSEVDHVFIPHDVQSEIEDGVIGTIMEGEEAVRACERAVQQGRLPRGG